MRDKIVSEIYSDNSYINYCYKVCRGRDIHKDLFQYVILYLMEMPQDKLERIYNEGGLRSYVARIIYCSINGNRSQFLKQINGEPCESLPIIEPKQSVFNYHYSNDGMEDFISKKAKSFISSGTVLQYGEEVAYNVNFTLKKVNEVLNSEELYWKKKDMYPAPVRLFEIYLELGSFMEVSRATLIPYKTVRRHINDLINKIKENL